jgi:Tfp pilus assembly protein PilF
MIGKSAAIYALGLVLLLAAYRMSAAYYTPHTPLVTHLAERQAGMAAFFINSQRDKQALELCHQAVVTDPDSDRAHFSLALLYERNEMFAEAMREYRKAIDCRPDSTDAHVNLGILLGQSGLLDEAAEHFRAVGDDPKAQYNLKITEQAIEQRKRGQYP